MGHRISVSLDVDAPDESNIPHLVEVLARVQAALAMDGYEPRLNVWRYETETADIEEA